MNLWDLIWQVSWRGVYRDQMWLYCDKVLTTNYKIGVEKQIQIFKFPKGSFAGFFLFSWNMPFYVQLIIVVNCCYCRLWGFRSDFVLGSCTTTWGKASLNELLLRSLDVRCLRNSSYSRRARLKLVWVLFLSWTSQIKLFNGFELNFNNRTIRLVQFVYPA